VTAAQRILVAGIGNIFLGDDGFGVEVVKRLSGLRLPEGVHVRDFGIRGMDLVYALLDEYRAVIFVDAAPRGEPPGTLTLIEPQLRDERRVSIETHGMDPVKVLGLATELGAPRRPTYVVACEPQHVPPGETDAEMSMGLSEPVEAAIDEAVRLVQTLLARLTSVPAEA
jgi:hydrogenase maturation protease